MAIKKGMKVVVAKNFGPENKSDTRDDDDYYFPDAENTSDIELGSKGTVSRVDGNKIYVEIEDRGGDEFPFHIKELKFPGQNVTLDPLGKLPQPYVFVLASQMPIFLINDIVYSLDGSQGNLRSDFFKVSDNGSSSRRGLVESATLSQLEELTRAHHAKEYDKIERKYLQEVVEERSRNGDGDKHKLVDFIVNEVFPYFRGDGHNNSKIGQLLGLRISNEEKSGKHEPQKPKEQSKEETFVSRLIDEIEKERFQRGEDEEKKNKKLDTLLGYDPRWDVSEFPQDYDPSSSLGKILAGRNVAVVDNIFYNLVWTNSDQHRRVLNIGGKNFALVSPKPLEEVKARYDFELSKAVRIGALKDKLTQDSQLRALAQRNSNIGELVRRKEYIEGDFGFVREEDDWNDEDNEEHSGVSYTVFLNVPKHVIKMPDDYEIYDDNGHKKKKQDRYYWFDRTRVAVRVFLDDDNKISYDKPISLDGDDYEHPFMMGDGDICLGDYSYHKLDKFKRGEAIARLLTDTRTVLLSGYTRGKTPASMPLEEFENRRITLSEARRRNLPITNVNLEKGRRRR